MKAPGTRTTLVVLTLFALLYGGLAVYRLTLKSATWDEPQHLTAGYAALTQHDYRLDFEHPPLARMWAAWPVAMSRGIQFDAAGRWWQQGPQWFFCHQFLYQDNPADWLLLRARLMIVALGLAVGLLLFGWARAWYGWWPAVVVLGLYLLEPNLMAHAGLVTTDFALVALSFATVYFLWRLTQRFTPWNVAGAIGCFALAQATKFSAVLLGPVAVGLLAVYGWRQHQWRRAGLVLAGMVVAGYLAIWASYGFRYAATPQPAPAFRFEVANDPRVQQAPRWLAGSVDWIGRHRLLPQAYAEGWLLGQAKARERNSYLLGRQSLTGWWYYFPVAFLVKTPISVILLGLAGLGFCAVRWREKIGREWFALWPVLVFFGTAMTASLNIGLRHILPVYPFLLLLAGGVVARLWDTRWRVAIIGLVAFAAVEFAVVYPHCLAAFNLAVGGPSRGEYYLIDSNLDWGQDLKGLKRWMTRKGVDRINLSYFGTADPAYYGIDCTYIPGSPFFAFDQMQAPRLPGYVAVSVTNLRGVNATEEARRFFGPLRTQSPVATIGHSIKVYWMEQPWW